MARISDAPSILIVDDEATLRERLAKAFRGRGFEVFAAADCDEAVAIAKETAPEMAVVDLRMPGRSGLDLIAELKAIDPETKIVMLTGYGSIASAIDATKLGATYYLPKPADVDDILAAFARGQAPVLEAASTEFSVPSLERLKWEHINRVLADCGGNISEAARRLNMHRRSLQRILQKYPPNT